MHLTSALPYVALLALLGIGCPAAAQTPYRCGSSYQDQPCTAAQPSGGAIGGVAHAFAPSAAALTSDPAGAPAADTRCHQRGIDAEKTRWAKEGGRTLQQAQQTNAADSTFLQDVYGRRGTAAEVRLAVEQDCNQDLQRAREAARLNAAAAEILKGNSGAAPAASSAVPSTEASASAHH